MRIRFFNTYQPVAPLYRDLLPRLAQRGWDVEVLQSSQSYRPGEWSDPEENIRIQRIPAPLSRVWPGSLRRAWIPLTYAAGAALTTLFGRDVDVNLFLTQPPLFSCWGRILRRFRGQPYCCVVMDLYPWVAIQAGVLSKGGLLTRLLEWLSAGSLRNAFSVFVIGRCMADRVKSLGVAAESVHLAPNWANTDQIRPVHPCSNQLRKELELEGRFVILYSGNLGVSHYFDDLLEVAGRLQSEPDFQFIFIGGGSRLKEVKSGVHQRSLNNVRFLPYQQYSRLSESLSAGDVHFVSLREGFEGLVVPSKAYGILAAGRPILYQGSSRGEIARLVEESGAGVVINPGDVDNLERTLRELHNDANLRSEMGHRARRAIELEYSPDRAMSVYMEVLEEAIRRR